MESVEAVDSLLSMRDSRRVGRYLLPLFPSLDAPPERFERARRQAMSHPLLVGHLLSDDLKTSLVIAIDSVAGIRQDAGFRRRGLAIAGSNLRGWGGSV